MKAGTSLLARRVSAVLILASLVLVVPFTTVAAFQEFYFYPPWSAADGQRYPNQAGCCYDRYLREFWDPPRASDGVARFSEHVQAIGPSGGLNDLAYMTFFGTQFVAPYTGAYQMDYLWQLSGSAALCLNTPAGIGSARAALWFAGNLLNVNTGYWVLGNDASTTAFDYSYPGGYFCLSWSWNNALFGVSFSGYLYAGYTYQLFTYGKAFLEAISTIGSWNHADLDLTPTNTEFYMNTNAGGPPCLAIGTRVLMENGNTEKIESVDTESRVMSYDFETGSLVPSTVTLSKFRHVDQLVVINEGLLEITPVGQAVYARNGTWVGWVSNAFELRTGMELFNPERGTWTRIYAITTETGDFQVYDLSVTPMHNFVANGVLVHNK